MKKRTKIILGALTLGLGAVVLSGCTASFCSTCDTAHMLYVYDNGVTKYYDASDLPTGINTYELKLDGVSNVYFSYNFSNNYGGLNNIIESAEKNGIQTPKCDQYYAAMDIVLVKKAIETSKRTVSSKQEMDNLLTDYGYLKYSSTKESNQVWDSYETFQDEAVALMRSLNGEYGISYDISKCPTSDFVTYYKTQMNSLVANNKGCIAVTSGNYGYYGYGENKTSVYIEAKDYGYAWNKGFLEGLLIYPIGAFVDVLCNSMQGLGTGIAGSGTQGWAQLLAIVIVTIVVRSIMFALSFKSTIGNAKMTELQPEVAKIQAKYPNSNTSQAEKARMADEMNKLYKKHKINPFSSILIMIVQFPVFICVWGALTGSAWLTTGSFCNLNLSDSISSVLFNGECWGNGSAPTALVLFLLMAAAQVVSMLLPQWLQKSKAKKVAKLGKNPAQNSQNRTMKIVTYVMMVMIIFMGFSLASAMGVYWFVGALFSIAQTLITQAITSRQAKEKKI